MKMSTQSCWVGNRVMAKTINLVNITPLPYMRHKRITRTWLSILRIQLLIHAPDTCLYPQDHCIRRRNQCVKSYIFMLPFVIDGKSDIHSIPHSKVYGPNMGPTWGRQDPGGPHVGHMNVVIWDMLSYEGRWILQTFVSPNLIQGLLPWLFLAP